MEYVFRGQYHFGMKAHIGVNAEFGMVHTVRGTSGHVSDIAKANTLLHGQESSRPASGEGVTPASCDEAPVWICARALSRLEEKNTAQLFTLFALSNLWMMRSKLMGIGARVRPKTGQVPCKGRNGPPKVEKTAKLQQLA